MHKNFREDLIYKDECYRIVGACFEVYKEKGCGYSEPIYQESLGIEFELSCIRALAQPLVALSYKGRPLTSRFVPDFIVFDKIIVELKALDELTDKHRAQVINYLKATGYELGILINFGAYPKLEWERIPRAKRLNPPPNSGEGVGERADLLSRPFVTLADLNPSADA